MLSFVPEVVAQEPSGGNPPSEQGGPEQRGQQNGPRPVFGKITAIQNGVIEIASPDGQTVKVKYTDQTQFRKDRQPAKLSDFKVGDMVAVRGEQSADHTINATLIGARAGGGMMGGSAGTLGKDYVVGEV